MISSCPNYLRADVSNGGDWSLHQQEVTGGQLVTLSLVPGTVDSNVALDCHLCSSPRYLLYGEGILPGQQLRALFLETELEKRKKEKVCLSLSVSLIKGDRVRTKLIGRQGEGHVAQVCLKGGNVSQNVGESSVEPGATCCGIFWEVLWGGPQV